MFAVIFTVQILGWTEQDESPYLGKIFILLEIHLVMKKYKLKIKFKASKTETSAYNISPKGNTGRSFLEAAEAEENSSATEVEANSLPEQGFLPVTIVNMKHKRGHKSGHKKGKRKLQLVEKDFDTNIDDVNAEDDSGLDDADDFQSTSALETEMTSPETVKTSTHMTTDSDGQNDRPVGRVKVKLRSRLLEPQRAYSNEQTLSDTDKSNQQIMSETHGEMSEKEDGVNSRPETPTTVTSRTTKKAGSIKIKTSRGLGSSGAVMPDKHVNHSISRAEIQEERNHIVLENEKNVDSSASRESNQIVKKIARQDPRYNEKELAASIRVIKEVMKMDAAEPFNAPVNPVALGIPDYFDIIDTPMDFGTICHYLENGLKYMNSEDVLKDVQFIWKNCYRYNSKGNYILDLMKRVKKHFRKCWTAAGLHCEQPQKKMSDVVLDQNSADVTQEDDHGKDKSLQELTERKTIVMMPKKETFTSPIVDRRVNGSGNNQADDFGRSSTGKVKVYKKSGSSKHKTRKKIGINHHKSGCLCAVCILMRRRREREENDRMQRRVIDGNSAQDFKQEENSPLDNPGSEDDGMNLDNSPDFDADDVDEQGDDIKLETLDLDDSLQNDKQEMSEDETGEKVLPVNGAGEEFTGQSQASEAESSRHAALLYEQKDEGSRQERGEAGVNHEEDAEQKQKELTKRQKKAKLLEDPLLQENPLILHMCTTLFPGDTKSLWSGPHSLIRRPFPARASPIHAAVSMFMK